MRLISLGTRLFDQSFFSLTKSSELHIADLLWDESDSNSWVPSQRTSNAERFSISWRLMILLMVFYARIPMVTACLKMTYGPRSTPFYLKVGILKSHSNISYTWDNCRANKIVLNANGQVMNISINYTHCGLVTLYSNLDPDQHWLRPNITSHLWGSVAFTREQFQSELLTHWGRDKMDAISQTTFSSAFSWMKMFEYRLKLHWSLFLRVQLCVTRPQCVNLYNEVENYTSKILGVIELVSFSPCKYTDMIRCDLLSQWLRIRYIS